MKLIIEVEKDYYEMIKYNVEHGQEYKPFEIIANGIPYEATQGDLISREALKKAMEEERQFLLARGQTGAEHILVHHCLPIIDNAPTVEQKYYERVIAQITPEIVARPQGEWVEDYTAKKKRIVACNKCHCLNIMGKSNFCPNCGADMRGDTNV